MDVCIIRGIPAAITLGFGQTPIDIQDFTHVMAAMGVEITEAGPAFTDPAQGTRYEAKSKRFDTITVLTFVNSYLAVFGDAVMSTTTT